MRDITLEDTIYPKFTTRAFATGIPTTLAGTPVVSAYENDSATQITAGVTLSVDHDSVTGLNMVTVAATAANGFENGKEYALVITTGTVGGVSVVGEVIEQFTIGSAAAAVDLANGTDGLGALATLITTVDTVVDAIQTETDKIDAAHAEPTGVPAANETPLDKLAYLFMMARNQVTVTATKKTYFDDGGTAEFEKDLSDDATTYTETEANAI